MVEDIIAVCNHIKDTKIHQITTLDTSFKNIYTLYVITSKIQKLIKSQHESNLALMPSSCM